MFSGSFILSISAKQVRTVCVGIVTSVYPSACLSVCPQ